MLDESPLGTRICVVGTSGSGKTYVAQRLATILDLRYVSNDALIWGPEWTEVPRAARPAAFEAATRDGGWTIDGNYAGNDAEDAIVLSRCDTIVWLDLPRWQVMASITWRTLKRASTRERLWHGNVEPWYRIATRDSMLLWAWRSYQRRKRQYTALFADPAYGAKRRLRFRSRAEVNRWLASLVAGPQAGSS